MEGKSGGEKCFWLLFCVWGKNTSAPPRCWTINVSGKGNDIMMPSLIPQGKYVVGVRVIWLMGGWDLCGGCMTSCMVVSFHSLLRDFWPLILKVAEGCRFMTSSVATCYWWGARGLPIPGLDISISSNGFFHELENFFSVSMAMPPESSSLPWEVVGFWNIQVYQSAQAEWESCTV